MFTSLFHTFSHLIGWNHATLSTGTTKEGYEYLCTECTKCHRKKFLTWRMNQPTHITKQQLKEYREYKVLWGGKLEDW